MAELICISLQTYIKHYFNINIATLKYKRHLSPSLYPCLFTWDNKTTIDTGKAQEPSTYVCKEIKTTAPPN